MRTYIAATDIGFGDAIICLPVISAIIDKCPNVYLVARSFRQSGIAERIKGIKGEIAESELKLEEGDRYINLRDHPLQLNYVWGSPEFESFFGPTKIEKIVEAIAKDFGFEVDYSHLPKLEHTIRKDLSNCIAFVPGTDLFHKHWPHSYWMSVYKELRKAEQEVIVLGRPAESPAVQRLLNEGLKWIETPSIADSIDVISSCRAVLAIDTGLMHVAVTQGIPTFALLHPAYYHMRSANNCFNLTGSHCDPDCCRDLTPPAGFMAASNLQVKHKFNRRECTLPLAQNCMAKIKPEDVIELMKKQNVFSLSV
ncbi:MAG: hypothetical protein K2X77_32320 [Candidatus Obscuribacterales bacterium]|nr:hypothetical protein [Candidatus Obscuribacterales bacterium]